MDGKYFYTAFQELFDAAKDTLSIYQKEEFYRSLFHSVYEMAGDGMYANDAIRKVTSGGQNIHVHAMKQLCTDVGFEAFRKDVEQSIVSIDSIKSVIEKLMHICKETENIPVEIIEQIKNGLVEYTNYQISRAVAAILLCLDREDYIRRMISKKKTVIFPDVGFMRLTADKALPTYPRYITDGYSGAVNEAINREDDWKEVYEKLLDTDSKLLVTGVGGLGKTVFVQQLLDHVMHTPMTECGIEKIAWIPYDNHDIRLSMKQAFRLQCDLEDVWQAVQDKCADDRERLLLVVDNIENVDNDEYLRKLSSLPCRILATSRQRKLSGFHNWQLEPLTMEQCRNLFYQHYQFPNRDNEIVNDIIELTAKLTIMIVFLGKIAYLEGLSLSELYRRLLESGFKLSEEDVSCEHEKMQNDETIIRQMCILFSLVRYSEIDKVILTHISLIPSLQFDFPKAKKWFGVKKNSSLLKLYQMGMLEHTLAERKHIYWMHSVIAAAVREQQKDLLYSLSRSFVNIMSEELDTGIAHGREYEKSYLIPFSWSIADILEGHWQDEEDTDFLTNLFHVCFSCSNYSLCEKLIDVVIRVQTSTSNFSTLEKAFSYRNKIDLLLQFDRVEEAFTFLQEVEAMFDRESTPVKDREILNYQYGIFYQVLGNYKKSKEYLLKCVKAAEESTETTQKKDLSTACCNMARMLVDSGDLFEAYDYIKRAIQAEDSDEDDADQIVCYSTLGAICTELMGAGFGTNYIQEAADAFKKVIKFREAKLGLHHADTAVAYHDYAYFWYICGCYDEALDYNERACRIYEKMFAEHSITRLRNLNTKALIVWEQGKYAQADDIFDYIIVTAEEMNSDYLPDIADFAFNYARCLHDQGDDQGAKKFYDKCIQIWTRISEDRNRKLALAHQELADIYFSEGSAEKAIINYELTIRYNTEDFYVQVDAMDSLAACLVLSNRMEEGVQKFKKVLQLLVEYNAQDKETKYQLCSNLTCVLAAETEEEKEIFDLLMASLKKEPEILDYIQNFDTNSVKN